MHSPFLKESPPTANIYLSMYLIFYRLPLSTLYRLPPVSSAHYRLGGTRRVNHDCCKLHFSTKRLDQFWVKPCYYVNFKVRAMIKQSMDRIEVHLLDYVKITE